MECVQEHAVSPSCNDAHNVEDVNSEGSIFQVGQKFLFSVSSISLSAKDLQHLKMVQEIVDEVSPEEGPEDEPAESETEIQQETNCTSKSEEQTNKKPNSHWQGFLRKIKNGPGMHLHSFHPSIPSLPSIKKTTTKKSWNTGQSLPPLQPPADGAGSLNQCLESSWKNFSLAELQTATNNFSKDNLIGEGGYSEVYKGHLQDGQLVAVKRLTRGSQEEMTSDYLSELGILVHVNHPNISNVIGYGVEGGMHLVLPLSPHGSLASLLKGDKEKLGWGHRYGIAVGIASGLSYLHEGCQRRIIHRDIKAANVLLTQNFEPQISDFGLAKWLPDQWTHLTVSQFEGTFGYLPPEFFMHGLVDEKTDVYAFGVLLLEIITGRPALDELNRSVVMWAKPLLISKSFEELADPALGGSYDAEQMNLLVMIASLCIHQSSAERPPMSQVVLMLKGNQTTVPKKKKFEKSSALRRRCKMQSFDSDESSTKSANETGQKNEVAVEQ